MSRPRIDSSVHPDVQRALNELYDRTDFLKGDSADSGNSASLTRFRRSIIDKIQTLPGLQLFQGNSSGLKAAGIGQASLLPTITGALTYANDGTSITWSWTGRKLLWPNGDQDPVPDGSLATTGLANSTAYVFYPYYDIVLNRIKFVTGITGFVGTPAAAQAATSPKSDVAAQICVMDGHLPAGGTTVNIQASTTGGAPGPGGSDGGSGCIAGRMRLMHRRRGVIPSIEAVVGDEVLGDGKWQTVTGKRVVDDENWIDIMGNRERLSVSGAHPMFAMTPELTRAVKSAELWTMSDLLVGEAGRFYLTDGMIRMPQVPNVRQKFVMLETMPDHEFLFGEYQPWCLAHNVIIEK